MRVTRAKDQAGRNMVGPWTGDEWQSFLALDVEPRTPNALLRGGLLGYMLYGDPNGARVEWLEQFVKDGWKTRYAHPVYKALKSDQHFRDAYRLFESKRARATHGNIRTPTAPFRFLQLFVQSAGYAYQLCGPNRRKSLKKDQKAGASNLGSYSKRRKAAIKHANALLELVSQGVRLSDFSETQKLEELLKALSFQLRATTRKSYGGERDMPRWILKQLALDLLIRFDFRSPALLAHFADMVGLACDIKTAGRYCKDAEKERNRLRLAAALEQHIAKQHGQKASEK